jgi:signal transduction histidine kinase
MTTTGLVVFTVVPLLALVTSALYASVAAYRMRDWRPVLFVVVVVLMSIHQVNEVSIYLQTGAASASTGFGEFPETGVNLLTSIGAVAVLRSVERQRSLSSQLSEKLERERELKQENERLDEFISIISHDLRNPLNVAKSRLALIERETDTEHTEEMHGAFDRMETIIEHTLTLAREGDTVTESEPIAVRQLVEECWTMVETGGATLEVVDDCTVYGDPDRVRHIFENLLKNSVDHGGDDVTIRVGEADDRTLFVEDNGPGIPASERNAVLEPGQSMADGGTGFGLAIVNRMAQAHGWELTVTDGTENGARFEFEGAFHRPVPQSS